MCDCCSVAAAPGQADTWCCERCREPGSPATRETSQTSSQPETPYTGASQRTPRQQPQQQQQPGNRPKKGGMFKRLGNALTARAQQAATRAGESGYYYV